MYDRKINSGNFVPLDFYISRIKKNLRGAPLRLPLPLPCSTSLVTCASLWIHMHCQYESGNFCTSTDRIDLFLKNLSVSEKLWYAFFLRCFAMLSTKSSILHLGNNVFIPLPPKSMLTRTLNYSPIGEVWTNSSYDEHVIKCPFSLSRPSYTLNITSTLIWG